ncbi:MAG: PEP-CTERM sorting domain-containing protein, partial [Bryobacteraceae bacterium]|nr:PEP-CTERM sorting domain-containing protein [Bryobacteraceae bacterium]
ALSAASDPAGDEPSSIPEPVTMILLGTGLVAFGARALRKRSATRRR